MPILMRYTIFDTVTKKYLEIAAQPLGTDGQLVTKWTRRVERAWRFPGIKSASRMVKNLDGNGRFQVRNSKGEVVA